MVEPDTTGRQCSRTFGCRGVSSLALYVCQTRKFSSLIVIPPYRQPLLTTKTSPTRKHHWKSGLVGASPRACGAVKFCTSYPASIVIESSLLLNYLRASMSMWMHECVISRFDRQFFFIIISVFETSILQKFIMYNISPTDYYYLLQENIIQ